MSAPKTSLLWLILAVALVLPAVPALAERGERGLAGVTIYLDRLEIDGTSVKIQPVALPGGRSGRGSIRIQPVGDARALGEKARANRQVPKIIGHGKGSDGQMLRYELQRCFIKSWSTSGDADASPSGGTYYQIEFETVLLTQF